MLADYTSHFYIIYSNRVLVFLIQRNVAELFHHRQYRYDTFHVCLQRGSTTRQTTSNRTTVYCLSDFKPSAIQVGWGYIVWPLYYHSPSFRFTMVEYVPARCGNALIGQLHYPSGITLPASVFFPSHCILSRYGKARIHNLRYLRSPFIR